jgi:hypothetical protein
MPGAGRWGAKPQWRAAECHPFRSAVAILELDDVDQMLLLGQRHRHLTGAIRVNTQRLHGVITLQGKIKRRHAVGAPVGCRFAWPTRHAATHHA